MKWNVKKTVKELLISIVLIFILTNIISTIRKPALDSDQLPNIEVTLLDGSTFKPIEGKPLVIHFWATWCKVCKLEAQNIERLSKEYEVLTIVVNSGSDAEIEAYMKERDLTYKVFNDSEGKWSRKFKVEVFPTTFIYDDLGELRFSEVGYTSTAGLLARMAAVK
jgi:thiol-disulfide isomerase/thioredoxin